MAKTIMCEVCSRAGVEPHDIEAHFAHVQNQLNTIIDLLGICPACGGVGKNWPKKDSDCIECDGTGLIDPLQFPLSEPFGIN